MKKTILFIFLAVFYHTVCFADPAKELFDNGVLLFKQDRYQEAVEKFTSLITIAPANPDAYKNRGVCYMKLEKYDLAITDFEKAKELFPELKGLYSNLGVAWYYKKEYEKAVQNYDTEIEMAPDNYIAHFNRALCLTELRRDKDALESLSKTLSLKPDFYWALCYKGDLLARSGDIAKAIESYETALQKDHDNDYAKDKLASLQKQNKINQTPAPRNNPPVIKANPPAIKTGTSSNPGTSSGFSLQSGAFRNEANANQMKTKLIESGIEADILIVKDSKGREWFLVRSGSYASLDEARKSAVALKETTGLVPVIRPAGIW